GPPSAAGRPHRPLPGTVPPFRTSLADLGVAEAGGAPSSPSGPALPSSPGPPQAGPFHLGEKGPGKGGAPEPDTGRRGAVCGPPPQGAPRPPGDPSGRRRGDTPGDAPSVFLPRSAAPGSRSGPRPVADGRRTSGAGFSGRSGGRAAAVPGRSDPPLLAVVVTGE